MQFCYLIGFLALIIAGCSKGEFESFDSSLINPNHEPDLKVSEASSGAIQFSGIGYFANAGDCTEAAADFSLLLEGDLEGCLYVTVDGHDCSPSGTYRETGSEYFVGTYNGQEGTFETTYKFEAKYEGCEDGFFVGAEIFGRCQHPYVRGSGTGVFEGIEGRLNFKDNVVTGELPYKGHLRL